MPAYNFPDNPASGDVYERWTYNGEAWEMTGGDTTTPPTDTLTVTSLTPNTSPIGEASVKVTIAGTSFSSASVVNWDGRELRTTFINATTLEVDIFPDTVYTPGAVDVLVKDGTEVSNTVVFTYTAATAVLTS